MASWFTRAIDTITPWNRGGEVERRKKREEERNRWQPQRSTQAPQQSSNNSGLRVTNTPSTARVSVDGYEEEPKPEPKQTKNIFEDINKTLNFNKPNNAVDVTNRFQPTDRPKPGTVVKPTLKVENRPNNTKIKLPSFDAMDKEAQDKHLIERDLDAGKSWEDIARNNRFDLDAVKQYSQATRPNYGIKVERPNQSIFDRIVRDRFDANTQADQWRRQEGNALPGATEKPIVLENPGNIVSQTPIVGHVTKVLNTLGAQIAQLPSTAEGYFLTQKQRELTEKLMQAQRNGDANMYAVLAEQLDALSDEVNQAFAMQSAGMGQFEKNSGGLFNTGTLYDEEGARAGDAETAIRDVALPSAVAALDLFTLGKGNLVDDAIRGTIKNQGILQGTKTGIQSQASNIAKIGAGNFGSGTADALAKDASVDDAIKAGLITAPMATIPDVALPGIAKLLKSRLLPKAFGRGGNSAIDALDNTAIDASVDDLLRETASTPRPITVSKNIPVDQPQLPAQPVNVRNLTEPKPLIREVGGDEALATPNPLIKQNAIDTRANQVRNNAFEQNRNVPKPDSRIEGVTPRTPESTYKLDPEVVASGQAGMIDDYAKWLKEMGEGNGVYLIPDGEAYGYGMKRVTNNVRFGDTKGKRMTKQMWRDEAERQLRAGEAEPGLQQAFNEAQDPEIQSLLAKGEQTPIETGKPIKVQEQKNIPVRDETVVPNKTPEAPGKVQVTTKTEPMKAKTEAVAKTPTAKTPVSLPKETQEILDNPKKFTKRQVASARNQRKLARQMAKTQEETAEAMSRIEGAKPAKQGDEGFAPTGEFKKGKNNNTYEVVSKKTEMEQGIRETATTSPKAVIEKARQNQAKNGGFSPKDIRDAEAIIETRRVQRGTPEFVEIQKILKESGSDWGKTGALRRGTKMRRSASANELISRYETKIYGLADDPTKIDSKLFDKVEAAETAFVEARDNATAAYNRFTESPTSANAKAFHAAQDAADKADIGAAQTEYTVAKQALKGNNDIRQVRELRKLATQADLGKMDHVDSAMLSGTGTMARNLVNAVPGAIEEGLFGKGAAAIASKATKTKVGGGLGRNTLSDFGKSAKDFSNKAKVMKQDSGSIFRHPIENLKTWTTLGNELGDTVIDTTARQSMESYYRQVLKSQGFKGKELADRLSVMSRMDPEMALPTYQQIARVDAGLSGGNIAKQAKMEQTLTNSISDIISVGKPSAKTDAIAKALVRVTVGFPSAVMRATGTGVKRLTGVGPLYDFAKAIRETDPTKKALLLKQSLKQGASSATVIPGLFYTLGNAGMLSGSYPTGDKAEQARWEREGISENSIKIGDAWYQYPAFLGAWAVPAMFWGNMGRTEGDFGTSAKDMAKGITDIVPTDQLSRIKEVIDGRYDAGKFAASMGAGTVRALTPAGALLNQVAKTFDTTKNDTNTRGVMDNFIDKVFGGIPGGDKVRDIPDKIDDAGNSIKNPSVIQTLTGATSAVQGKGEERTATIQAEVNEALKNIDQYGLLNDPNMEGVIEGTAKEALVKANAGRQLNEAEIKALKKNMVKNVSSEGTDTTYLEKGQYDTNLAVLKMKRDLMNEDPTTKPSSLEKIETAIKRGEVYKEKQTPYQDIDDYKSIGVEAWRKMGDPEDENYDPDRYEKLWQLDQLMTEKGVSYGKELDKNKYYLKDSTSGSGRGGSGSSKQRKLGGDFGKLSSNKFGPQVKQYETIQTQAGGIPKIRVKRPNIVHKITTGR